MERLVGVDAHRRDRARQARDPRGAHQARLVGGCDDCLVRGQSQGGAEVRLDQLAIAGDRGERRVTRRDQNRVAAAAQGLLEGMRVAQCVGLRVRDRQADVAGARPVGHARREVRSRGHAEPGPMEAAADRHAPAFLGVRDERSRACVRAGHARGRLRGRLRTSRWAGSADE